MTDEELDAALESARVTRSLIQSHGKTPTPVAELVAEVRRLREALERIAINSYEQPDENGRRGPLRYGYCDAGCSGIAVDALGQDFCSEKNLAAVRARLLAAKP